MSCETNLFIGVLLLLSRKNCIPGENCTGFVQPGNSVRGTVFPRELGPGGDRIP